MALRQTQTRGWGILAIRCEEHFAIAGNSFILSTFKLGTGQWPFQTTGQGYDRAELFALPHPWYTTNSPDTTPPPPTDTTPPETSLTGGPTGTTTATDAAFSFSSSESGSSFQCRLDSGAWTACTSPRTQSGMSAGTHLFEVRSTDAAGNVDPSPASRSWTVTSASDKALGRPATASSISHAAMGAANATDGVSSTRWSSAFADNQWWQVDLGSMQQVDRVQLNWEAAYAARYRIQTSTDGATFTTASDVTITTPGVKSTTFTARNARYVRVQGVTRATKYGISFWDANVYGPTGTTPPPPPAASYADAILGTSGLSSYWRLGEASGTTAAAAKGAITGTYGTGVTLGRPGLITGDMNTAAGFGGASGADTRFGDAFDFPANDRFTLEAWVKPTIVDATSRRIFSKEWSNASGVQGYYLINKSTRLQFARMRDGGYHTVNVAPLATGTRYHVAVTYDGTSLRLYVNGALAGSADAAAALLNGTTAFTIGAKTGGGGHFNGVIDEPAVYNANTLTGTQLNAHYEAGR